MEWPTSAGSSRELTLRNRLNTMAGTTLAFLNLTIGNVTIDKNELIPGLSSGRSPVINKGILYLSGDYVRANLHWQGKIA